MKKQNSHNLILPSNLPLKEIKNPVMKCDKNGVCTWVEGSVDSYKLKGKNK